MAEIDDLDTTDANNTARWPEGMLGGDINDAARALVTEVWPLGDMEQGAVSASVGYRQALPGASKVYTAASSMNRVGFCPQRIDARFGSVRLQVSAGASWRRMEGVHITAAPTGGR